MSLRVISRLLTVILLSVGSYVALANAAGHVSLLTRETKLTASDAAAFALFGDAVAVSGDTALVGAPDYSQAYVFVRSAGVWSQQQILRATGPGGCHLFGDSVAVSGDTAVVGCPDESDVGVSSGAAYVFVRNEGVWSQQQRLTASDAAERDYFGWSVSVSGDTAVVGARDAGQFSGSAYVFVRSEGVWSQQQRLISNDDPEPYQFGLSVAVSGDTAVVGATWKAHVFVRSEGVWVEQQTLTANGYFVPNSVALSGDTAVVGNPYDYEPAGATSGSAYVFVRNLGVWSQQQKLTASDAAESDQFGWSVGVSGDRVVVGARLDDDAGGDCGSGYVFVRSAGVWSQQQKLTASDAAERDQFGFSVAVSGDTAVVGARWDSDAGQFSGSAYVYEPASMLLSALSPAKIWVGLKNSDGVGLRLDLLAEVFIDGTTVGQGELDNVGGGSSGFNNAFLQTFPLTLTGGSVEAPSGAQLSIRVSARRTCFGGGNNSGTARLWYDGQLTDSGASRDAASRFDATIGGTMSDYFLRSGSALSTTAGSSRTSADASVNSSAPCPARPFTAFGTWSRTLP